MKIQKRIFLEDHIPSLSSYLDKVESIAVYDDQRIYKQGLAPIPSVTFKNSEAIYSISRFESEDMIYSTDIMNLLNYYTKDKLRIIRNRKRRKNG